MSQLPGNGLKISNGSTCSLAVRPGWAARHSRLLACGLSLLVHSALLCAGVSFAVHSLRPTHTSPRIEFVWGDQGAEGSERNPGEIPGATMSVPPTLPANMLATEQHDRAAIPAVIRKTILEGLTEDQPNPSSLNSKVQLTNYPSLASNDHNNSNDNISAVGSSVTNVGPKVLTKLPAPASDGANGENAEVAGGVAGGRSGIVGGTLIQPLPHPVYPAESLRSGKQGTVTLDVEILADGSIGKIVIIADAGYPRLAEAAIAAVRQARITPATMDGKPVVSAVRIPFIFVLKQPR